MASNLNRSSLHGRHNSSQGTRDPMRRTRSHKRVPVSDDDAYTYALRAAYLAYLLLPRQKRVQHIANSSKPIQRSTNSINDMVKDFSLMRDNKSTKFPHAFMGALDKRITGVLVGQEKMPEYNDNLIKRTFATFLNEFKNPTFRKSMETDRKVEPLLLIFFSKATSELQKGRAPEDDSWKLMVDRHVALFVRLISSTLASNDWSRERPELTTRLKTLETKLLQHDNDLSDASQRNGGQGGTSVEVEIPRSYEVRDMPLVIRVCRIFSKATVQAQTDINLHRNEWTEKAALRDLKDYQNHMMLNDKVTLTKDDFDLDDAFESWRKGEFSDLSQMMLALVQSDPTLAQGGTTSALPNFKAAASSSSQNDALYAELGKSLSQAPDGESYAFDQPVDMSTLNISDSPRNSRIIAGESGQPNFTFIPPDPRMFYKQVLKSALTHDISDDELEPTAPAEGLPPMKLLSKQSIDLLNEIATRWRIPYCSRIVLFLDVVKEKYMQQESSLELVDHAFTYIQEPPIEPRKGGWKGMPAPVGFLERSQWTVADYALLSTVLSSIYDASLRELYETLSQCYENKPPSVGMILYVLENHIFADPQFSQNQEDLDAFSREMANALRIKAGEKYQDLLAKHVADDSSQWEFYNVIKLGQAVTGLCAKIQKRYSKNKTVMGVDPLKILCEQILPALIGDAEEIIKQIIVISKQKGEEVPVQDGFELYAELVEIRRVYYTALPEKAGEKGAEFKIENTLQDFVWRWVQMTDTKLLDWIEGAVAQDDWQVRQDAAAREHGDPPSDDERHSQSAIDIYRIFNQSIDQITKLGWDDDYQYAKFMTAISKSIGKGIARYCELLEAKFIREMDRNTPEQEARSAQTQRDKWLAAARDALSNPGSGQKITPFQFWPESFVKINDIEYATLQLDKVEQEMNVDGCVAAIQKREPIPPPNMRKRGENKFMFTIKIIEAEDLKAGDMNGLSDPYVVLGDEYQKRLAKTRTIYATLNPRWDETVDILTTGPLNVVATVWDWDALGDHDCLGRTNLKLDPSHFNDFLPREYWLDLDTQGRVLVRVSMEGERDDIEFYFAKAFRTLKRTERDMTRKVTDKLSAYIQQCLSRRTLKALTSTSSTTAAISSMRGYFSKVSGQVSGRPTSAISPAPQAIIAESANNALKPLLQYFDDNFAIMKQTLTDSAMILVMTRLWKEVLVTLEGLLVPPLSDKISSQKPLNQQEVDVVYKWLGTLFDFFHAFDHERGVADGVPLDVLKSPKYHDLQNLNFFYLETTENLIRTSERMATATAARQAEQSARLNRLSAPAGSILHSTPTTFAGRRTKSIMQSRNLGTMRKAKEEKRREAQAEPHDDMLLRILRMRPEAEKYLKDRSRQKERLAAAAAAEAIVRQSLQATRTLQGGGATAGARAGGLARRWDTIRE